MHFRISFSMEGPRIILLLQNAQQSDPRCATPSNNVFPAVVSVTPVTESITGCFPIRTASLPYYNTHTRAHSFVNIALVFGCLYAYVRAILRHSHGIQFS